MTNEQDKCREAFERWMIIEHYEPDMSRAAWDNDNYHNGLTLNCWIAYQAAYNQLSEENERLREALGLAKMQAEYIHVALEKPAEKNPVCASLRTWSGGIIRETKQALKANKEGE